MPVMTGTALNNLSYEDLVRWVNLSSGNPTYLDKYIAEAAKYGVGEMEAVEDMAATYMNFYKDGNGAYTITSFNSDAQISAINPVDSNIGTISRGNVQTPLNRAKDAITNKLQFSTTPASGSFAQNAAYFLGSVGQAVGCASVGITLGKTIEGALYNSNPDFWDSLGLWSINPETWKTITNGDDSWQAGLFNFIFGIDPDTGNGQLYMNQNAFAYMAMAMAQNGVFAPQTTIALPNENTSIQPTMPTPLQYCPVEGITSIWEYHAKNADTRYESSGSYAITQDGTSQVYIVGVIDPNYTISSPYYFHFYTVSRSPVLEVGYTEKTTNLRNGQVSTRQRSYSRTVGMNAAITLSDGSIAYTMPETSYMSAPSKDYQQNWLVSIPINSSAGIPLTNSHNIDIYMHDIAELIFLGTQSSEGEIDGISNQPNATQPDISGWDTVPNTLSSLQNQYPDLWNNPLVWDNYQPDGTNPQQVYIPVATPNSIAGTNTQPISSNSTQTSPQISPATSTQSLIDFITNVMTQTNPQTNPQTQEETDTQPKIPPQNPVDVGTGTTSPIIPPVGSASALWSVYHPTQAQVNSFGAWLWTGDIITQIQQLLQNPMEGIITLHKVFAPPVDSGNGTIVVGRLDSNVPSATVTQQYVTVDCGSIDCYEEFGNVFDYAPYTSVSIYLPFIGIAPLSVDDIMRSTIHVTYGVDVFTGACLAMIEVTRDGNTVNMYQYAGVASVEYPLTGSVHSGLITGIMGMVGGFATIATAGAAAPAAVGGVAAVGAGALSTGRQSQSRSGNFSGNAGAMGIKKPYLIIERPQTKVAETFPELAGYPTNYSCKLGDCSGHVVVKHAHIEGINATDTELEQIDSLLKDGVIV